ncbi:hypothetical protein FRB95_008845 [Tulasnella sp. JGI-2019a]|nr:hypothetical protein FRB95_008845 [Tulasnella sp. JGI-2019a]
MTRIKTALLTSRAFNFIRHCPSREIETVSIDSSSWPQRRYVPGKDRDARDTRLIEWLAGQQDVRILEIRREGGWLNEFHLPAGALSRLKTLACDASIAMMILPGRFVQCASINPTYPKLLGGPKPIAGQLSETPLPPALIARAQIRNEE